MGCLYIGGSSIASPISLAIFMTSEMKYTNRPIVIVISNAVSTVQIPCNQQLNASLVK
jgi:hypothetical protein